MNYRFLTPASVELYEAVFYYEDQCSGLGLRFLDYIEAAIDLVRKYPEAWRKISDHHSLCRVRKFPYGLIYTIDNGEILFVSVMNFHKHPDSWKGNIS